MRNTITTFIFQIAFFSVVNAQTTFQKTYGGTTGDNGYFGAQTSDGGFIIAGGTTSFGGEANYFIKTDTV